MPAHPIHRRRHRLARASAIVAMAVLMAVADARRGRRTGSGRVHRLVRRGSPVSRPSGRLGAIVARGPRQQRDPRHRRVALAGTDRLEPRGRRGQGVRLPQVDRRHRLRRRDVRVQPVPGQGERDRGRRLPLRPSRPIQGRRRPRGQVVRGSDRPAARRADARAGHRDERRPDPHPDDDLGAPLDREGPRADRCDRHGLHEPVRLARALRRLEAARARRLTLVGGALGRVLTAGSRRQLGRQGLGHVAVHEPWTRARHPGARRPGSAVQRNAGPAHDPQAEPGRAGRRRGDQHAGRPRVCGQSARRPSTRTPPSR